MQPVVAMTVSTGTPHSPHGRQLPRTYAVGVVGQQSVEQGTSVVVMRMKSGQSIAGALRQAGHLPGKRSALNACEENCVGMHE